MIVWDLWCEITPCFSHEPRNYTSIVIIISIVVEGIAMVLVTGLLGIGYRSWTALPYRIISYKHASLAMRILYFVFEGA